MLDMLLVLLVRDTRATHGVDSIILDIVDGVQEFALPAVHVRFLFGCAYQVEHAGGLAEDAVHFFQGATGSFGVEEVGHREDECVTILLDSVAQGGGGGGRRKLT